MLRTLQRAGRQVLRNPPKILCQQASRQNQTLLHVPITDSLYISSTMGERAFRQKAAMGPYFPDLKRDVDFCSCDTLALAVHEGINEIHAEAIVEYGGLDSTTEMIYPYPENSLAKRFLKEAAEWLQVEACVFSNSGADSNLRLLDVLLTGSDMPVYCEERAHATFVMGIAMAGKKKITFDQDSPEHLAKLLAEHGPGVVCVDSINSVLGTIGPLERYVEVCDEYKAVLIVDESHAVGHIGPEGRGILPELGIDKRVKFRTMGLGKTFACHGGLIACTQEVADIFDKVGGASRCTRRYQEHDAARLLATLDVIKRDQWRRDFLRDNITYFRKQVWDAGYQGIFVKNDSAVVPLVVGPELETCMYYYQMAERKVFPIPFTFPATARGRGELRFQISNYVDRAKIDQTVDVLKELYPTFKPWTWPDVTEEKYWSKSYLRL